MHITKHLLIRLPVTPPAQRVHFLLGDDVCETHDIFCEMEELRTVEDGEMEWKETARSVSNGDVFLTL